MTTVTIDNVTVTVDDPPEVADLLENITRLTDTAKNLRTQIQVLEGRNLNIDDESVPPGRYVLQTYHDEQIAMGKLQLKSLGDRHDRLIDEHVEWGDKNDNLERRRGELDKANVILLRQNENFVNQVDGQERNYKLLHGKYEEQTQVLNILRFAHEDLKARNDRQKEALEVLHKENNELTALLDIKTAPIEVIPADEKPAKQTKKRWPPKVDNKKGLTSKGKVRKYRPKLTDEQVWEIRRHDLRDRSNSWIAHRMSLPVQTVTKVTNKGAYTNVRPDPRTEKGRAHAGHEGEVTNGTS